MDTTQLKRIADALEEILRLVKQDMQKYEKRNIKHNNLLPWFTDDHGTLPASYLRSCEEFFKWLEDSKRNGFKAPSNKPQASGNKLDNK